MSDWLTFKIRGRIQPDDPNEENPPVTTGWDGDVGTQRTIDLYGVSEEHLYGPLEQPKKQAKDSETG